MIVRPMPVEALRVGPAGRLELNPDRALVQGWLQGTTQQSRVSITALGQTRDSIRVQAADVLSGDALFTAFTSDHLAPYRVQIYRQGGMPQAFMNVPIRVEFLTGLADDPLYFPVPIYVPAREGLEIQFQNLATEITNQIRFVAHGERYFAKNENDLRRLRLERYDPRSRAFWLGLDDTAVTLTASQTDVHKNMTVPSDGDFESEGFWVRATGPFKLKIATSLGGPPTMNGGGQNQVLVDSEQFGGGVYFYRWKAGPAYFKRMSVLDINLTNDLAASNVVEIVQVGRLLDYPEGSPNPSEYMASTPVATPGPSVSQMTGRQTPAHFLGLGFMGTR